MANRNNAARARARAGATAGRATADDLAGTRERRCRLDVVRTEFHRAMATRRRPHAEEQRSAPLPPALRRPVAALRCVSKQEAVAGTVTVFRDAPLRDPPRDAILRDARAAVRVARIAAVSARAPQDEVGGSADEVIE